MFGGPYNKDFSILGSILGYPNFGKLPFILIYCLAVKKLIVMYRFTVDDMISFIWKPTSFLNSSPVSGCRFGVQGPSS